MSKPILALVIPCYNERARLDVPAFLGYAKARPWLQLIFVDDGSRDGTPLLLTELREQLPEQIELLTFARNAGKAEAVRQGVLRACMRGVEFTGFWDADLATPLSEVEVFLARLKQHPELDAVIGSRVKLLGRRVERQILRHYLGRFFATAASITLRLPVYDTQCGAKLFRVSSRLRETFATPFLARWIFDVEVLARLDSISTREGSYHLAAAVYEEVLPQWLDKSGSKRKARDVFRALWDLLLINRHYGAAIRRLRTPAGNTKMEFEGEAQGCVL